MSHCGTKACLARNWRQVSVARWVTVCFTSALAANCLSDTCFSKGSLGWKSLDPILPKRLETGHSTTSGRLWPALPTVPISSMSPPIALLPPGISSTNLLIHSHFTNQMPYIKQITHCVHSIQFILLIHSNLPLVASVIPVTYLKWAPSMYF
jgi:hypothetical protein